MEYQLTSLSAGFAVAGSLSEALGDEITGVYPVNAAEDAKAPFITYHREGSQDEPIKQGHAFDTCNVVIDIYDSDYEHGLMLAEAARYAIERKKVTYTDEEDGTKKLVVDCGKVVSSDEGWTADGNYAQEFTVRCRMI